MKTVNSVSGGKTSAYIMANYPADYNVFSLVCIDDYSCAPKDKKLAQMVNDKLGERYIKEFGEFVATAEDDATLKVLFDLEQFTGKKITWVRGKSFDDVIDKANTNGKLTRLPSKQFRICTVEMKMVPIFYWWMENIGERINMRIGFRPDEFSRMERFFNDSNPSNFTIPVSCSTRGERRQKKAEFNWRFCQMPLIRDGVYKDDIELFWSKKGVVGGDLFQPFRKIKFPVISNCVGCFHKKPETLGAMCSLHPEKMQWFSRQENKGKGTWLNSGITYEQIINNSESFPYIEEMIQSVAGSCDSGGCHD